MEYNYKLDEKVNLTLEDIKFFLEAFNIQDFSKYNNTEFVNEDFNFNFFDESIILLFSTMLSLHYIGAIYLHIPYLGRNFPVIESSMEGNIQEYLYKNVDTYLSKIRIGDNGIQLRMGLALHTEDFILGFLQILYQEKDISLLENYRILNNIIKSLKSKGGKKIIQKEIDIFYDNELYKNNLYSIFPILVELNKKGYLNIREIKYEKGEIGFNVRILSDLDNIDQNEIIELFGSKDSIKIEKINKEKIDTIEEFKPEILNNSKNKIVDNTIIFWYEKLDQELYITHYKEGRFLIKKVTFDSDYEIVADYLYNEPNGIIFKSYIEEKEKREISEDLTTIKKLLKFNNILNKLFFDGANKDKLDFNKIITYKKLKDKSIKEEDVLLYLSKFR